jgi:hypothetical protein
VVSTAPAGRTPRLLLHLVRISPLDLLALGLAAGWLWVTSVPLPNGVFRFILLFLGSVIVGTLWLGRAAHLMYTTRKHRQPIRAHMARLLSIPAIALTTFCLVVTGAPELARFQVSRPALERAAERVIRGDPEASKQGGRIGLYTVINVMTIPGGMQMELKGMSGWDSMCGFAYSPPGRPTGLTAPDENQGWGKGYSYHDHLGGPWYVMCFHW